MDNISDSVLEKLVYKDINYPTKERLTKWAYVFRKMRNPQLILMDLERTGVSKNDYNDMIRGIKPLCFTTRIQYRNFVKDIAKIAATKFKNFTIKMFGSSTSFYSTHPSIKKKDKTFSITESDVDLTIIPNEDFEHYKPELENLNTLKYNIAQGLYGNALTRDFFGEEIMNKLFKKWGPQEFEPLVPQNKYEHIPKDDTILKRSISITLSSRIDMYDYFDIIKENKTCLPNFSTFIRDSKKLSYWNENNDLITEDL
jgi:hypothetical protein